MDKHKFTLKSLMKSNMRSYKAEKHTLDNVVIDVRLKKNPTATRNIVITNVENTKWHFYHCAHNRIESCWHIMLKQLQACICLHVFGSSVQSNYVVLPYCDKIDKTRVHCVCLLQVINSRNMADHSSSLCCFWKVALEQACKTWM